MRRPCWCRRRVPARCREGLDHAAGLEPRTRGLVLQAVEFVEAARVEGGETAAENLLHQRVLAAEVVIDRGVFAFAAPVITRIERR